MTMRAIHCFSTTLCLVIAKITVPSAAAPKNRESTEVCTTPVCQKAAQYLLESMNMSVDPCQDFYQYACGGWIRNHPIPDEKYRYATFDVLFDELRDTVAGILRNASSEDHTRAVLDAAMFYEACADREARESAGLESLKSFLNELGGWPMANPNWNGDGYEWQKQVATVDRNLDITAIISVSVDADANHTSQHIIYLDQPEAFGIGRNELKDRDASERNREIVTAYKNFMVATGKLLNPNADETQLRNEADEIIEFESKLAQFSKKPEDRRDASSWYHKMTLADVQRVTENTAFQWTDFLNVVLADFPKVTSETEVILSEKDYIKNTLKLIQETYSTNPRVLANYIGWIVLKKIGHHTTKAFRENKFAFDRVEMGIEKEEELERTCADDAVSAMGHAVGRSYVDKYFPQEDKEDVDGLVGSILSAYKSTLNSNTWMDEATKTKAIDKVDAMISKMGYPDWIKNDTRLNEYYKSVANTIRRDDFFSSYVRVRKAVNAIELKKWNQPTNRAEDWDTTAAVVNAFYNPSSNSISFPAGILRIPFYEYGRTSALNYGGIGAVIGHEVSHGFDDQGSQFDREGNLINWWSEETKERFDEKANCFRAQYASIVEPTTNMSLNGNNTVGENIADNGALRNAYIAYAADVLQSRGIVNKRLPGVPATPKQLFFIGFSSLWCGSERKESLEWSIQYDPHTLNQFRATVPLMNSDEFAEAFNCPLGTPMNPQDKCFLW